MTQDEIIEMWNSITKYAPSEVRITEFAKLVAAKAIAELESQETVAHWSDCAVHSEPAYPKGECDCGGYTPSPQRTEQEPVGRFAKFTDGIWREVTAGSAGIPLYKENT
jgi:hypothetical protein